MEELSLVDARIWKEDIEVAGRYCPLLKTLKLNQRADESDWVGSDDEDEDEDEDEVESVNELALAIGKNLPELTHLELIGNNMTNIGLKAILDGCCHLESLDLRRCFCIDLEGDLGKRCSRQIKYLKLPRDSLEGYPHTCYILSDSDVGFAFDSDDENMDYGDEYDQYSPDYDDYTDMFG